MTRYRLKIYLSVFALALLSALISSGLPGCAQYDNDAMAGAAVDIPDEKPMSEQPSLITQPTPGPSPKSTETVRQLLGQ